VINYLKASRYGKERLDELPISGRLLKKIHKILMDNVRGEEKNPGEFRHTQNWIGPVGSTLNSAKYVPPNPDDMKKSISDLEKFINQNDNMDFIIKAGLIHYQFETIHPFLDGNGRIGRLLINLFFIDKKVLTYETLYISYFLKRNRIEYYDRLMEVRNKGNFEQWVKFFLLAVKESAIDSIETIEALTKLHNENLEKINKLGRKASTVKDVFLYLEKQPIIEIKKTSEELSIAYNTVASAVESLEDLGILEQTKNVKRNRVFAYEKYLKILRKNT
jgi:Fic family protein